MSNLLHDFETKSGVDIRRGTMNYLNDPQADIVCCSLKVDDNKTTLWDAREAAPYEFKHVEDFDAVYAHNIQFDQSVWDTLGSAYGLPPLPLDKCIDVMALCGRYTIHQSLAKAGEDLGVKVLKDVKGKSLMKKICSPPFEYTEDELLDFFDYCVTDTDSMYEILHALPSTKLSAREQKIWEMTVRVNRKGLPMDVKSAKQIVKVVNIYQEEMTKLIPELTDGAVQRVTQVARIKGFCASLDIHLPNLQAETVEKALKLDSLPEKVKTILTLRQDLGKTSVAKFTKLLEIQHEGRVYNTLRYCGTGTRRWSGIDFQPQNLPRAKAEDPEALIEAFFDFSIIDEEVGI